MISHLLEYLYNRRHKKLYKWAAQTHAVHVILCIIDVNLGGEIVYASSTKGGLYAFCLLIAFSFLCEREALSVNPGSPGYIHVLVINC